MTESAELDVRESMSERTFAVTFIAVAVVIAGTFALVTVVALPVTALVLDGASPWSMAVGALAALAVGAVFVSRYRRSVRNPARLRFHSGGLVRSADNQNYSVSWSELEWVSVVHNSIAGDMVVIEPVAPASLSPDTKQGSREKRQNRVVHGGEIVFPLEVSGLSASELDERVAALSSGVHRVERRRPPKRRRERS